MIKRWLDLEKALHPRGSAFLFGARGTGKTHLARQWLGGGRRTLTYDLLDQRLFLKLLNRPGLFREEVGAALSSRSREPLRVLLDEVQRIPFLLNEVHSLMNDYPSQIQFLMTGSSARKLKRGGANLLAGRAYVTHLHPLTFLETPTRPMSSLLADGGLPGLLPEGVQRDRWLEAYTATYLKEEIQQEALVRRLDSFVRFLELAAQYNGEPVNHSLLARQGLGSVPTIQNYFSILVDTLVAIRVDGWSESVRRQLLMSPKYYFFDTGVLNALRGELTTPLNDRSFRYGRLFETLVVLEIFRLNDYLSRRWKLHYWRTSTGLEVDLILSRSSGASPLAIEIKSGETPEKADLKGLSAFLAENNKAKGYCLCRADRPRRVGPISILPWKEGIREILNLKEIKVP